MAVVLSNLPSVLCTQLLPRAGFEVPQVLSWLISLFCALLGLGVIKIALEQAVSAPKSFTSLFFPFSSGVFLNALILTLILGLFNLIVSATTTGMGVAGVHIFAIAAMLL